MRFTLANFWMLVICWLLTGDLQGQGQSASSGPVVSWPATVQGYGLTSDSARRDACKEVEKLLTGYLGQLTPPMLDWKPTEDFVKANLVDGPGKPGPEVTINDMQAKSWILTLKTPDLDQLRQLDSEARLTRQRQVRLHLSGERLGQAGRVFLEILVALVVISLGLRLESKVGDRYRLRIRLGGVLLVFGAGAAIYWLT